MAKRFPSLSSDQKMHLLALLVFLAISAFSLRVLFATSDPVAFHDLAPIYRLDQLFRPYNFPWDPQTNLGTPSMLTGNAVYNLPLIGISVILGSVTVASKVLLIGLMALSGFGFYLAFTYLMKSKTAGFVAGLYMMFNPFTLTRWEFGHNTVLLAYAVLPFAVLCFFKVMKEGGRTSMFLCGLLTALIIYASPQVAYLFIIFALLYAVYDVVFAGRSRMTKRLLLRATQVGAILAVSLVGAFPFFYQLAMVNLPVYATRAEEAIFEVSTARITETIIPQVILVVIAFFAFLFFWWKSGFTKLYRWWRSGETDDSSGFLIRTRSQQIHFFGMLGLISIILFLLVVPPFTPVYYWLFDNVPGLGMFREVDKFLMLSAFCFAFFLALTAEGLKNYLAKNQSKLHKVLPILLVSMMVFASSWQFTTGNVAGYVGTVNIPLAYQELNSWLANQDGDFRIAFFPPANWATNYIWAPREFLDPYVALQPKPTVDLQSAQDLTQSASLTRWVYSMLYSNRTSNWGKLLSILGVKYVILRLDADMPLNNSELSGFSLDNTLAAWSSQSGLQLEANFSSVRVYKTPNYLPTLYQADGLSIIVGDRGALTSLGNMKFDFGQYPAVFADDNIGLIDNLISDSSYIFYQGDPYWSLLTGYLDGEYVVKTWNYAPVSMKPTDKWVSGALTWYVHNGDVNAAPDGYIYTEGANKITIPLNAENSGKFRLLVQVYDGLPDSQGLEFTVDNSANYVFTPTRRVDGAYKWLDLGDQNLNPESQLQTSNIGGSAAISKIAVIPESLISQATQNTSVLLKASNALEVYLFDDRAWNYSDAALVMNPEANNGRLIALSKSSVQTEFYVFNEGTYTMNLTFQNPAEPASVKVQVDNMVRTVSLDQMLGSFTTDAVLGPFTFAQGYHNISIDAESGDAMFNMAKIFNYASDSDMHFHNSTVANIPEYTMQSGSECTVNVTSRYLAFLEAGNSYWKLYGPNGATSPIRILNYGNLYAIEEPNNQYTLKYLGLDYTQQGFIIAIVGVVLAAVSLKFLRFSRFKQETEANEV